MSDLLARIWEWVHGMLQAFVEWLILSMSEVLTGLFGLLPEGVTDYLANTIDIAGLAAIVSDITWIVPIWAILGMYTTAYGTGAVIRLVRWVLAIVPTVGG